MPYRTTVFAPQQIYHVFNRSIAKQPIFITKRDYQRALEVVSYYRFEELPMRFSHLQRLELKRRLMIIQNLQKLNNTSLTILAYCIMPTHVHFLLKPKTSLSIPTFMRNFQNSYAKYFNIKRKRSGSLFQTMFKAVRIETDEQFTHVSRYIHLNPVTSYSIRLEELETYPWSSFKSYVSNEQENFIDTRQLLEFFPSKDTYKEFVFDQADYQRELDHIKHLTFA